MMPVLRRSWLAAAFCLSAGCSLTFAGCERETDSKVWVEETVDLPLDVSGLSGFEIKTSNGNVTFTGGAADSSGSIKVSRKAGGATKEEAQAALADMEILSFREAGEHTLSWHWRTKNNPWAGEVSFAVSAPGTIRLDVETKNGEVKAVGIVGDVEVDTENGAVTIESRTGKLEAKTNNGLIDVTYAGSQVELETKNGKIKADLTQSGAVHGSLSTLNGAIELLVGPGTSAEVMAESGNGTVTNDADIAATASSRSRLTGKLGAGGDRLELRTNNGSIHIKAAK